MVKHGKWHQFIGVQINDNHENHQNDTNKTTSYLDPNKSNCETLQQTKTSEFIKTVDSTSDKQNNYERKTPTLNPTQKHCRRPNLNVAKLLKVKNRLSFKIKIISSLSCNVTNYTRIMKII